MSLGWITPARCWHPDHTGERRAMDRVRGQVRGSSTPKRPAGVQPSFTFMHNHTGSHLDTLGHVLPRECAFTTTCPRQRRWAPCKAMQQASSRWSGAGVLLDVAA